MTEIKRAVKCLKNNKSPSTDGVSGELIKADGEVVLNKVHNFCNKVRKERQIPDEW